ncbi:hypothetical protein fHeYen902_219 [Yersinia phage fHe-Yen9-02]|nr:hypothetical protein fHeYen902_219 [Yersinia phage fHe-Yen9-02]
MPASKVIPKYAPKPVAREQSLNMVCQVFIASCGKDATLISQLFFLNTTNYYWLSDIDPKDNRQVANETMIRLVREVNKYCRQSKIPLGLLIIPHTSASGFDGDEIVVIPWRAISNNAIAMESVKSLMERVKAEGYEEYVVDAMTEDK